MATLMPTKDQALEIGAGILAIRETTQGIRKSLGKEVKRDKAASKKKQGFLRRMFARKKKADAEKMIEARNWSTGEQKSILFSIFLAVLRVYRKIYRVLKLIE